jgi:hypothetical protein
MILILIVLLVLFAGGGLGYHSGWYGAGIVPSSYGYGGIGLLGTIILVLLVLALIGRI